jgi:preprotein translocase subunit YajC
MAEEIMNNFWDNMLASSIALLVLMLIMIAVLAIMSYRGTAKRKKRFENMHQDLKVGQKIVTATGIYGTIKNVSEETVDIEIKSGAVMTVSRFTIAEIIS